MEILINPPKNVIKDLLDDTEKHYIAKENYFAVAIAYISYPSGQIGSNFLADQTYFTISFNNLNYTRSNGEYYIQNMPVELAYCNDTFPFSNSEFYQRKSMSSYLCPINNEYYIQGDFNSKEFVDVEIIIHKWVNSSENNNHCKSQDEISKAVNGGYIDIALVNTYFDFDDYKNPIKRYVGASEIMFMSENYTHHFEGFIQQNTVLDSNNLFYTSSYK